MLFRLSFRRSFSTSNMAPVNIKTAANDFLSFVNASPTPFHAVRSVKERLTSAGFKEIKVRWSSEFRSPNADNGDRSEHHGHQRACRVESTS